MDKNEHLPGDSLADFTEEELFSLIDAGTTGAFSEFYRRHIASAATFAALTAADTPNPRARADAAFLAILKSLLNGSADRTSSIVALICDEISRGPDRGSAASSPEFAEAEPEDLSSSALIASSFSSLPDNWQRILWLREVEGQSAQSAAELLGITSATAERLTARAHEELENTWAQTRPADGPRSIADRAELVPALLTSPILIERLSDTFVAAPQSDHDTEAAAAGSVDTDELPAATEPPDAAYSGESGADASEPSAVTAASEAPKATGEPSTETIDETTTAAAATLQMTAAPSASAHSANYPAAKSDGPTDHDENAKFTLPKPVLIPLIAACLGLLCTLLGFAILPHGASEPGPRTNSTTDAGTGSTPDSASTTDARDETSASTGSGSSASTDPAHRDDPPSRRDEDRDTSPREGDRAAESPADSSSSTPTGTPSKPADSDDPTTPEEPSAPDEPESPDTPSQPEPTDDPGTPTEPGTPSEPETPDDPGTPSEPEPSDDPGTPSEPGSPSTTGGSATSVRPEPEGPNRQGLWTREIAN
ncbi:DNA-directed RNA polymerase specialized sigma subunit, sigma24 family [Brevibacterium siliguriense]|uniref:DNA-directed RNA polymerase specialized sigma subunit, sigma24 family n=2 Tax=Brevibacterium siliguriense TaxID=1136497 RepID=A0A1H1N450_9MICO|nr:DNA-directed RNA polymerase specialized sigma subunit, sigma24 family [Brevibacterium siliguriense]